MFAEERATSSDGMEDFSIAVCKYLVTLLLLLLRILRVHRRGVREENLWNVVKFVSAFRIRSRFI